MEQWEERLRASLRAQADDVIPPADLLAAARADGRALVRRRHGLLAAAAATTALLVAAAPVALGLGDDRASMPAGPSPSTSATATPTATGAATPSPSPSETRTADDALLALADDGLWLIRRDDGERVRRLLGPEQLGEGASGLAVSPDRRTAYLSRARTGCTSEVVAVPVAGGEPSVVAVGSAPAVSPDGTRLAFARDPECDQRSEVVVRDLADGSEHVLAAYDPGEHDPLPAAVTRITWTSTSRSLVLEFQFEDGPELRVVPAGDRSALSGNRVPASPDGAQWTHPAVRADGTLLVLEACCDYDARPRRVVAVDPVTGARLAVVLSSAARLVDVAVGTTGTYAVTADGRVLRASGASGEPEQLARGYREVA